MKIIAIDGPSGAGKTTIGNLLAKKFNFIHIDTGSMYRALAYYAKQEKIDITNEKVLESKLIPMVKEIKLSLSDSEEIFLAGSNITNKIRNDEISSLASEISKNKNIREKLVDFQREIAKNSNVVMDGRDIATKVFVNADIKIFLTASLDDRATRRYREYKNKEVSINKIKKDMYFRDIEDTNRINSPLKACRDSIIVDTSGNTLDESILLISSIIKNKLNI